MFQSCLRSASSILLGCARRPVGCRGLRLALAVGCLLGVAGLAKAQVVRKVEFKGKCDYGSTETMANFIVPKGTYKLEVTGAMSAIQGIYAELEYFDTATGFYLQRPDIWPRRDCRKTETTWEGDAWKFIPAGSYRVKSWMEYSTTVGMQTNYYKTDPYYENIMFAK